MFAASRVPLQSLLRFRAAICPVPRPTPLPRESSAEGGGKHGTAGCARAAPRGSADSFFS